MKGGLKSVVALDRFCRVLEELSNKENLLGKRVFLCRWSRVDTFSLMMGMVSILLIAISAASYIKFSSYSWISFVGDTIFVLCSNFVFFITIFINRKRVYSFRKRYKILLNSTVGYIRSLDPETLSYCSNISGNQIVGLDAHITIRDAKLVVLPAILLVPGDVIVIKPGQTIFAFCKQLNSNENSRVFIPGDIFVPRKLNCNLSPTITASVEESDKPMMAIVTRSPLTSYLEIALSSNKKKKCTPQPLSCKVLHSAVAVSVIINITITFSLLISTFIIFCLHDIREPGFRIIMWFIRTLGVLTTSSSSFFFCLIWMIAISISTLRFQHVLSNFQNLLQSFDSDELSCVYSVDQPKVSCISHQNSSSSSSVIASLRSFCSMFCLQTFVDLENILLTLGTLSSVCCVNQEGVISQPLPTPEKVFFFHRRHHHHHFQENFSTYKSQTPISKRNLTEQGYSCQQCSRSDQLNTSTFPRTTKHCDDLCQREINDVKNLVHKNADDPGETPSFQRNSSPQLNNNVMPVVLNFRTDFRHPSGSHFEKPRWDRFISSLKPIGLSILLNNCHSSVKKQRLGFFDSVNAMQKYFISSSCISSLPLSFCLCGLASQIGFRDGAVNGFMADGCLGVYSFCSTAHVTDSESSDDNASRSGGINDNRIHLGHCFSAVFSNMNTENSYQLLSQGTGDILVSLCSDIWDGRDIVPLSESERELILGFHNRHLSSAYCIGFAYSPLVDKASESYKSLLNNLSDSKDILMLRLPGSENISPLLQRSPATCTNFDNINRGLLPLSHDVGSNEDNHNGVTPSEISIKFQNKKKSSQRDVNSHPKVINKMRKASLYSNSNFKKLNTNQRRSQSIGDKYFTSFLSSRDISDNHEKIKLNPINMGINDSFDEYRTDSIANELPRTKCVPEGDVYCETIDANHEEKDDLYIDPKEVRSILDNQIFLGLISMQYQANPQVVKTIKQLHQACIRFVHFSRENELRSRVFAERLGLECGWNCHISLRSPESHSNYKSSYQTKERRSNRISIVTSDFVSSRKKSASARPLIRSSSLPSLSTSHSLSSTNKIISASDHNLRQSNDNKKNMCFKPTSTQPKFSQANATIQARELHSKIPHIDDTNNNSSRSLSFTDTPQFVMRKSDTKESLSDFCLSSSSSSTSTSSVSQSAVEQSDTSQDRTMSDLLTANKSRLPCGIESIRPHLENIDNVPLQVSLFTDCSPKAIGEMVKIMKEYGDTVCLVGSCYSLTNYALFLQSDVAIAVKPILPYSTCEFANHPMDCRKQTDCQLNESDCSNSHLINTNQKDCSSRVNMFDIAARLMHLVTPCLLDMEKEGFRVYDLIVEAHASVNNLYHCLIFSCATPLSVGLLQLLLFIVGLPTRPLMISDIQMNSGQNELIWLPADPFRSYLLGSREIFNNLSRFDAYTNINLLNYNKNCDLEPLFSIGQLFWLLFVVIPALTLSLIDRRIERNQPLREPPIKRNKLFTKKRCVRFALVTCSRFIPSVLICLFCEVGHFLWTQQFNDCQTSFQSIYANRSDTRNVFIMNSSTSNNQISVSSMYDVQTSCLSNLSLLIYSVKDLIFYQFITYLVIISFSYANYGQRLWQFRYCTNPSWCIVSSLIFISHTLYVIIRFCILTSSSKLTSWQVLSPAVLAFGFNWGILLVFINEFVSWKESKYVGFEGLDHF
uniref:Transmembrane protein 94 n=1 Tax=Trichobilharzia regenti TaxID=157069 RepID=A0AA85IUL8_TRIRE|nr:unnamed protein product [Trichobilharzia regenti]